MIRRSVFLSLFVAAALSLTACGGASDTSESATEPPASSESEADPAEETSDETTESEPADEPVGSGEYKTCEEYLSTDEIDSILGTSVEIKGSDGICRYIFADDSVGGLTVWTGSKADQAMDENMAVFTGNANKSANGLLLEDDRGFIDEYGAVVRGDSEVVFTLGIPTNVEVPDVRAAMQQFVDLLLPR